jgi:methylmalonyl-CoA mutase C-terminal domain/subunit
MSDRPLRILVAKPGLDGHDRGAKIIARALRDAGFEVIYTGLHQTPEMIVEAALQEDVDAIGLSILSGAHLTLFPAILDRMKTQGLDNVVVFGGGIIEDDISKLADIGVQASFAPARPRRRSSSGCATACGRTRAERIAARLVTGDRGVRFARRSDRRRGTGGIRARAPSGGVRSGRCRRTLVVEKQRHPRHKVCAGGHPSHAWVPEQLDVALAVRSFAAFSGPGHYVAPDRGGGGEGVRRCCSRVKERAWRSGKTEGRRHQRELGRRVFARRRNSRIVVGADGSGSVSVGCSSRRRL